jgi:hypothetical protein
MLKEYYYGILNLGEGEFLGHGEGEMSKFGIDIPNGFDMPTERFIEKIAEYNFLDQLWETEGADWPMIFRIWEMDGTLLGDWAVAMFFNERTHERLFGTENKARKDWKMDMEDGPKFVARKINNDSSNDQDAA